MTTFIASTITEAAKTDDSRFEMTFVDADGKRHTVSIPSAIAADLVPLLEQVAAAQAQTMAELTRLPKACKVGSTRSATAKFCCASTMSRLTQSDWKLPRLWD